jgi:hypothetical protein
MSTSSLHLIPTASPLVLSASDTVSKFRLVGAVFVERSSRVDADPLLLVVRDEAILRRAVDRLFLHAQHSECRGIPHQGPAEYDLALPSKLAIYMRRILQLVIELCSPNPSTHVGEATIPSGTSQPATEFLNQRIELGHGPGDRGNILSRFSASPRTTPHTPPPAW